MKNDYRSFFANVKSYIKFKPFLDMVGINQSAFSRYLKDEMFNYEVSEEKLQKLYYAIIDFCKNIV